MTNMNRRARWPKIEVCNFFLFIFFGLFITHCLHCVKGDSNENLCDKAVQNDGKYLLYDVNAGEGFNLRRDVYIRIANLVRHLNNYEPWTLVLPPWGRLYHWNTKFHYQYYSWKSFFDVKSLAKWISVIELEEFIKIKGQNFSSAFVLQSFVEGWGTKFEEKYEIRPCIDDHEFLQSSKDTWQFTKWKESFVVSNFSCLSFQGHASYITKLLTQDLKNAKSVLLDRAETLLHDDFSGTKYWSARRSMRFASHLVAEASMFRQNYLDSNDDQDRTVVSADWRDFKPLRGNALGGSYLAVHLRRKDFLYSRKTLVPSLENAALQLRKVLLKMNLSKLFIATDTSLKEFGELVNLLKEFKVVKYTPPASFQGGDGEIAIIDQIICSHARFFIGTAESTFSFRIQEEREILGFPAESTFNCLCGDENPSCQQPTQWNIVY